jgi:hypothetical protein
VYVNRLELSVVVNLLASADGTGGVSNDSGPQFKHSFLGQRAEKLSDNRLWRCGRQ